MKVIKICIGSACHLKGSYEVINVFQDLIKEKGLEFDMELKAAFCLGHCTHAVTVERWDGALISVSRNNIKEIFETQFEAYL